MRARYIWVNSAAGLSPSYAVLKVHLRGLSALLRCVAAPHPSPDVSSPSLSLFEVMSDSVAGLLIDLYETNRATACSNLLVGIVFGEQLNPPLIANSDQLIMVSPRKKTPHHCANLGSSSSRSLRRPLWHLALHSPVSAPFLFHVHKSH